MFISLPHNNIMCGLYCEYSNFHDTTHKELYTIEGHGFSHEVTVITQDT